TLELCAPAVALRAGVEREAEDPERVGLAQPEQPRRHRQVAVEAGEDERLRDRRRPRGPCRLDGRQAVRDAACGTREDGAELLLAEPGGARRAGGEEERVRLLPVGIVRGVDDLL